ncbi:hypothetical protein DH2020_011340 [Rehmannia glutinosa]|uniref:Pentatricopeptide repeat-containing protein n=1 Tax=Rehmannia glutinosa TaxID=99300 RepID=A0ABR0XD51_REHGL
MPPCFLSFNPPSTSISKFISDQPFLSMLETNCHSIKDLKKIHAHLIKTGLAKDTIAASRVLAFCATARDLDYAFSVFCQIEKQNLFTWNTIIRGFCQSSNPHIAISLFVEMLVSSTVHPEKLTYPSVFKAYTHLGLAEDGAQLHGRIIKLGLEFDPFIRNSIIHMYANCGLLGNARKLFDENTDSDVVAWNSMVMGLAKCGQVEEAWGCSLKCRPETRRLGIDMKIRPSEFTVVSILNACAKLGALEQGKWIHDYIKKNDIEMNVIVVTAIIDMYCKCGNIETARQVFETAPRKGLSSWNSMMLGLATNGFGNEVFELFSELESSNLRPVPVGLIEEAAEVIRSMPMKPDAIIWGSLLSACKIHRDVDVAEWAARNLILSDPDETSAHVLMSNVYAASGDLKKAVQERVKMKEKMMEKQPGCSLIEVNGEVHEFVAGGKWQFSSAG